MTEYDIDYAARKSGILPDGSVAVVNLGTMQTVGIYGCTAREAVIAAYAASIGDGNTWDYAATYGEMVRDLPSSVSCGDFAAMKPRGERETDQDDEKGIADMELWEIAMQTESSEVYSRVNEQYLTRNVISEVRSCIIDSECSGDDEDEITELADSLVDIYSADLLKWIGGDPNARGWIDEANRELGYPDDFDRSIMQGQYLMYRDAFTEVLDALEAMREELEEMAEDEDEIDEGGYVVSQSGALGGRYVVTQYGKAIGSWVEADDVDEAIRKHMKENEYYPDVWFVSDHGNVSKWGV